jgi:hypothetical protein
VNAARGGACLVLAPHVCGDADPALERFPGRAAADLPCDCVQRDAGHTMTLVQALPGDAVVALFAAMSASGP